jgi:flagellar basal body P-ring formation protein FlgA
MARWLALGVMVWPSVVFADVRSLPVLSVTLYPGDAIAASQLMDKRFTGNTKVFSAYVQEPREIEGKFARRTIVAGLPIARTAIKDRDVVYQGTPTLAVLKMQGMVISTTLLPLESGAAGQAIRARNPDSGLTVVAVAEEDGTLRVGAE